MRLRAWVRRLTTRPRPDAAGLRRWLENTQHFLRLTALLAVPVLIGVVTWLANAVELLPFLLFPPLASGAYTLFTTPESPHADPRRFVGGMTIGAAAGWTALELTSRYWYTVETAGFAVNPGAAAFGVLLTGLATWLLDVQVPQAFSTALLVLVVGGDQLVFVGGVFVSAVLVVGVAIGWRETVYDRRAELLYRTIDGDDHVLVPIRHNTTQATTAFAAQIAAAHDAGTVVLCDVFEPPAENSPRPTSEDATDRHVDTRATRLEARAERLAERYDVATDVVIVRGDGDDPGTVLQTARETNSDLIVTPYEREDDGLSTFVRGLFDGEIDVVAARLGENRAWREVLVPIRRAGDVAHAMLDFAGRLVGVAGTVTTVTAIDSERDRRTAESRLADLAETFERTAETRVVRSSIEAHLDRVATRYDLVIVGSSRDRSAASRFIAPPTFQELDSLPCDVAIVHRG